MEIEKEVENFKDVIRADYKKWLDEKLRMEKDIRVYVDALYGIENNVIRESGE